MKYSIITAVYNGAEYIERALASILGQSWPDWEWIVQDGASTDNTLALLGKYSDVRIKTASEPDTGIYDAWNKAVERASGDWALFLGADDCLLHCHTLAQCKRHLNLLPERIQFAFGAMLQGHNGKGEYLNNQMLHAAYHRMLFNMGVPFPATFIRMDLLKQEKFNPRYKITGDYDFTARLITKDNLARIPVLISYMEYGGISHNAQAPAVLNERMRVLCTSVSPRAGEFVLGCAKYLSGDTDFLEEAACI